jgi:cardiolipin synthase A/B
MGAKLASRMSHGRRRSGSERAAQRIFIEPAERRAAVLEVISNARQRLVLSLFRCNDYGVLDALAEALARGVAVEAILTKRAKGGKKPLKKLWEALEEMGALVHWYGDPVVKYHAKYLVADGRIALVATLNPTVKCFTRTVDFVYTTEEPSVVRSVSTLFSLDAAGQRVAPRHRLTDRLIVGPEASRPRLRELIPRARKSIRILDHKLSDPDLVSLLRERRDEGVEVTVIGRHLAGPWKPHGKLMLIDGTRAVLGSMALSALSLDFRREVSIVLQHRPIVSALNDYFMGLTERAGEWSKLLPGDAGA